MQKQTLTFFNIFIKLTTLWILISFLPLWLLASYFSKGKIIINCILQFSKLDYNIQSLKNHIQSAKTKIFNLIKPIFNHSTKLKYPFGFAMLKKNGMYITTDNQFPFVIQLYDYLSRKFMYSKNLSGSRIMEIQPTTEGGLEYLATCLKAASCLGITNDQTLIRSLKKTNLNPRVKYLHLPKFESSQIKNNNFDVVIGINLFLKNTTMNDTVKLIKKSLKSSGYVCIAQYLLTQQISSFQLFLKSQGFLIVKTQNLSSNLSNAIKIQSSLENNQTILQKFKGIINYFIQQDNINIDVLSELQTRRKFMGYILQMQTK